MNSISNASWFQVTQFNVVDVDKAYLLITANVHDSFANITYSGAKTDLESGLHTAVPPFHEGTYAISPGDTIKVPIDLENEAFDGGYGSIKVSSTDGAFSPSESPCSLLVCFSISLFNNKFTKQFSSGIR